MQSRKNKKARVAGMQCEGEEGLSEVREIGRDQSCGPHRPQSGVWSST